MTFHGPRAFLEGPETPTEWKSESMTDLPTNQLTRVGSRDT